MKYTVRPAKVSDYSFLFELKKAAEFPVIEQVFGWNEQDQRVIHAREWQEDRPTIIEVEGKAVGSYLWKISEEQCYLGRFFILPEYQGRGLGSDVLSQLLTEADRLGVPTTLCYLQGNRVAKLYQQFGFSKNSEDDAFVYMKREPSV
ncbi:GNAT family N-acetyltransferase [Vibrio sp. TRT 21S02]|uniref:GNAT family N-acetyltransferase n=1 Tax=Vibrio sp. TRT 21S02 TaxID=3418507 RepID=UPI003CF5D1F9